MTEISTSEPSSPTNPAMADTVTDQRKVLPTIHDGTTDWWHAFNDVRLELLDVEDRFSWHDGGFNPADRLGVLVEEVGEVGSALVNDGFGELYEELRQVAAVAIRWMHWAKVEDDDRKMREWSQEAPNAG